MQEVFISSVQGDFDDVRSAVRGALESLGMRALMAESAGAHTTSPQRALLDLIARCDLFLVVIGARYSTPTEDEFKAGLELGPTRVLDASQAVTVASWTRRGP